MGGQQYLFNTQYVFIRNGVEEKTTGTICLLHLGTGSTSSKNNFYMVDQSHGDNPSRVQIDATLDGQLHAIGTRIGVGTYTMYFFDAPVTNTDSSAVSDNSGVTGMSPFGWYNQTKSLAERKAKVILQWKDENNKKASSDPIAVLDGLVTSASTAQKEINGVLYFGTALQVTGVWSLNE